MTIEVLMKPEENGVPYENNDQAYGAIKDAAMKIHEILVKHRVNLLIPKPGSALLRFQSEFKLGDEIKTHTSAFNEIMSYYPHDYKEPTIDDIMISTPTRNGDRAAKDIEMGLDTIVSVLKGFGLRIVADEGAFDVCAEFTDKDGSRRIQEKTFTLLPDPIPGSRHA